MKKSKVLHLLIGFVAGVSFLTISIIACEVVNTGLAATIGNAMDLVYDNTTSDLTATNTQSAIDEVKNNADSLKTRVLTLESSGNIITTEKLTGTWVGTVYSDSVAYEDFTITLASDGSFTCSGSGDSGNDVKLFNGDGEECSGNYSWELKGHTILLTPISGANNYRVIQVNSVNDTNIALFTSLEIKSQFEFFYGAKQ